MERENAERLIEELIKRPGLREFNADKFANLLISLEMPESSRFHEEISDEKQYFFEYGKSHCLYLRRLLRNGNASGYKLSKPKEIFERLASKFGVYDSDALTRKLRRNQDIVNLMVQSAEHGNPFSMLARFDTAEYEIPGKESETKRPVLVILGLTDAEKTPIYEWESENTICEEQTRVFGIPV